MSDIFAQDDTLSSLAVSPPDSSSLDTGTVWKSDFGLQLAYSTAGFILGYGATGGIQFAIDKSQGSGAGFSFWPIITPLTTSFGCHLAGTDYYRRRGGSYWEGVIAGFLGLIAGIGLEVGVSNIESLSSSPIAVTLAYYVPMVSFTMLFYNLGTDNDVKDNLQSSNVLVSPWYSNGYFGASFIVQY